MMTDAPIILSLETSTDFCSVALAYLGNISFKEIHCAQNHTQIILPLIQTILEEAKISLQEIDYLAVGQGPGSFTGVRIAISVAQGLAYGLQKKVYPISTLQALAYQASTVKQADYYLCLLDARMHEVYAGLYQHPSFKLISPEIVCKPEDLSELFNKIQGSVLCVGNGIEVCKEYNILNSIDILNDIQRPTALAIAQLALRQLTQGIQPQSAMTLLPSYIRNQVAIAKS